LRPTLRSFRFLSTLLLLAGCLDVSVAPTALKGPAAPTTPTSPAGVWGLTSWNQKPLPARYATFLGNCSLADCNLAVPDSILYISAGTINLTSAGEYVRITDWRMEYPSGKAPTVTQEREAGDYQGGTFLVQLDAGAGRMWRGEIVGNVMTAKMVFNGVTLGDAWNYVR
jgi:hypothetical protein